MNDQKLFEDLRENVIKGKKEKITELVESALEKNISPKSILDGPLTEGIQEVGKLYDQGEYFLPDLMMGAETMKEAVGLINPEIEKLGEDTSSKAKGLAGTVEGDLHDIGKTIVLTFLTANGFEVNDLGPDVPAESFVQEVKDGGYEFLLLSSLLTTTMPRQEEVIEALEEAGLRDELKILVGGAPVNQEWADDIGADAYGENASEAVKLVEELIG